PVPVFTLMSWSPSTAITFRFTGRAKSSPGTGVEIDRSTLANWVGGACWWLEPLQARLAAHVFGSTKLFADDTPIPVLDPGRGRTKTGRLWVYARDDRPWSGPEPPAAVYFYSPDRKAERPAAHLQDFRGVLQVDGYAGFERLTAPGDIVLAACWAHARRKFYDLHEATGSPIAAEALRRISEADKRQILREAMRPDSRFSEVARRYGIAERVLFRWKQETAPVAAPLFASVEITDANAPTDTVANDREY